jgi:hypothetical protein
MCVEVSNKSNYQSKPHLQVKVVPIKHHAMKTHGGVGTLENVTKFCVYFIHFLTVNIYLLLISDN